MASPLPTVSYKEFLKNPIIGILFLSLGALSYLYIDNKGNYVDVIDKQEKRMIILEKKIENLVLNIVLRLTKL